MNAEFPGPDPDEVEQGITALERHLAELAETPQTDRADRADRPDDADAERPAAAGETRRVRRLRGQVAEAHLLAGLQSDDTPLFLDSLKVRKRRRAAHEAARLHQLAQDPAMRAWQAARMRRVLVSAAMVALALALGWSTAGVQVFAADNAPAWSPAWLFAWLVEPFMSLALLTVVGAKAYMAVCGQPIDSKTLNRIEALFLGLTLTMNAWRYLPWIAEPFSLSRLVLHILGPVVAVAVVMALPIILAAFAGLDHGITAPLTAPAYSTNTPAREAAGNPPARVDVAALTAKARWLIEAGDLPPEPSANAIQKALHCGMDTARQIRDALREGTDR